MQKRKIAYPFHWFMILALAWGFVQPSVTQAEDEIEEDLVWKIAQIVLDTAAGHPVDDGPSETQVARFRQMGANSIGPSWGVKKRIDRSAVDGKPIDLIYNVTILPEGYKESDSQKANWKKYGLEKPDEHTGAKIAFRAVQEGDVRRHRVIYSLERSGYRLFMMIGREGDETAEQAVKKTLNGFHKFYDNAVRLGLFEPENDIFITLVKAEYADHRGAVADGQVIHIARPEAELHFKIHADAAHFEEDEPYVLALDFKTPAGHAPMQILGSNGRQLPDENKDGIYELHVKAPGKENAVGLMIKSDKSAAAKKDKGSYAAGPASMIRIRITKIDEDGNVTIEPEGVNFGVQASTWYPIVTRFEVFHLTQKVEGDGKAEEKNLEPMFAGFKGSFSTLAGTVAALDETFKKKIVPIAKNSGKIGDKDPVMLGWRLHPGNPDYVLIQLDQDGKDFDTHIVAIPQNSKPFFALWMDVVSPSAKGEDADVETETWGDFGGGMDTQQGTESDPKVDMNRHAEEFERQIHLDTSDDEANGIWVNRIAYIPDDKVWKTESEMKADIRRMLRLPVGGADAKNPKDPDEKISYKMPFFQLENGDVRYEDLKKKLLTADPVQIRELAKTPGVYEIRFKARPYNINGIRPTDPAYDKQIDVAIRYAVIPTRFVPQLMQWKQERQE